MVAFFGLRDIIFEGVADADDVRVGAAIQTAAVGLSADEEGVACADIAALVGELIEVGDDGDFVGHGD